MRNAVALLILIFAVFSDVSLYAMDADECLTYYADADNDGFGNPLVSVVSCTGTPAGFVLNNTDCNDLAAAVRPGAAEIGYNLIDDDCDGLTDEGFVPKVTSVSGAYCNIELAAIDSYIYAGIVSGATGYRWRVTTMSGPNTGQIQFVNTVLRSFKVTLLANFAYETQYKIEVAVFYAGFLQPFTPSDCIITTPPALTRLSNCEYGTWISSMNSIIYARLMANAQAYRFRIVDPINPSNTQTITRNLREFRMNLITAFPVHYNWIYNVDVAFKNSDGVWSEYGDVCEVNTPIFPTTMVQDIQCHDGMGSPYLVQSMSTAIYADAYWGAIAYAFRLHGPGIPAEGFEVVNAHRWFSLNEFPSLIPGETYNVSVRLIFNHLFEPGPYGKVCTFIVPGAARLANNAQIDVRAVPNPFSESFTIKADALGECEIKIHDLSGRLLDEIITDGSDLPSITFGEKLPSGIYHVELRHADNRTFVRMVKK